MNTAVELLKSYNAEDSVIDAFYYKNWAYYCTKFQSIIRLEHSLVSDTETVFMYDSSTNQYFNVDVPEVSMHFIKQLYVGKFINMNTLPTLVENNDFPININVIRYEIMQQNGVNIEQEKVISVVDTPRNDMVTSNNGNDYQRFFDSQDIATDIDIERDPIFEGTPFSQLEDDDPATALIDNIVVSITYIIHTIFPWGLY